MQYYIYQNEASTLDLLVIDDTGKKSVLFQTLSPLGDKPIVIAPVNINYEKATEFINFHKF